MRSRCPTASGSSGRATSDVLYAWCVQLDIDPEEYLDPDDEESLVTNKLMHQLIGERLGIEV